MKQSDIERLKQVDAGTLERFAMLSHDEQAKIIELIKQPALDPKATHADREIATARADQFKRAAKGVGKTKGKGDRKPK